MKTALFALIAAFLCFDVAQARKSYIVKNEYHGMRPKVQATNYPTYTVYQKDDGDEVSIKLKVQLSLGWEFDDEVEEDQDGAMSMYRMNFDILSKAMFYFSPLLSFPRFIYFEPSFEAAEFPIAFRTEMYYFYNVDSTSKPNRMCWSIYLTVDEVEILA